MKNNPKARLTKQNGATLIVALILLLVMSLIALTSMSTSVLEEKMSVNLQNYVNVFQVAESGIDLTINDISILQQVTSTSTSSQPNTITLGATAKAQAETIVNFMREKNNDDGASPDATVAGGSWQGGGRGSSATATRYYEAESKAKLINNSNVKTALTQGFYYCVPGCQ